MKDRLGDIARLKHIYDAILEIESYTKEISENTFAEHTMM